MFDHCPICKYYDIYLDVDEPHIIQCMLKYAIEVWFVGERKWWRWTNPNVERMDGALKVTR